MWQKDDVNCSKNPFYPAARADDESTALHEVGKESERAGENEREKEREREAGGIYA